MVACTHLCRRFNSVLDQHLLSWLDEYPWTKLELALTWLTLLLCCNGTVGPPWWHHMSSHFSRNNPGTSWLWNLRCKTTSEQQFIHFMKAFLQQWPKRHLHLCVGKASTTGHFTHLCMKIVLNGCLSSPDLVHLRYLLFSFFSFFVADIDDMPMQGIFNAFMRCCQGFWVIIFAATHRTLENASRQVS